MKELQERLRLFIAASSSALVARRPLRRASPGEYSLSDAFLHSNLYTMSREGMSCSFNTILGFTGVSKHVSSNPCNDKKKAEWG